MANAEKLTASSHAFCTSYAGWIMKRGHQVKNWKNRYFVVKGCTVSYFDDEISDSKIILPGSVSALKGCHIITGVEEVKEDGNLGWTINTEQGKEFQLRAHNEAVRRTAMDAMRNAAELFGQKKQRIAEDMPLKVMLALQLCESGALLLALPLLQQVVCELTSNASAHYHLGTALLAAGDAVAAIVALERAIELQPDFDDAGINLAAALTLEGTRTHEAKARLKNLLKRSNNNVAAAHNLAMLLVVEKSYEEALELLTYALQCDASLSSLYVAQAEVLYMLSQPSAAIDALRCGLENCAHSSDIYCRLGQILLSTGDDHSGIANLQEAVDTNPKNAEALFLLEMAIKRREDDSDLPFDVWMTQTLQQCASYDNADSTENCSIASSATTTSIPFANGSNSAQQKRQSIFGGMFNNEKSKSGVAVARRGSSFT